METLSAINKFSNYYGKYKNEPVQESDLLKLIDAGLTAATLYEQNNIHIVAVNDPLILKKMHPLLKGLLCETAPAVICVIIHNPTKVGNRIFSYQNSATASQNILIAATDLGYQCRWIKSELFDMDKIGDRISEIIEIPGDYHLECVIPVGKAKSDGPPLYNKDSSRRSWFNKFGNK